MLYLETLKFNNLGRFTEEQVFNFKDHSNLLLIDGPSGVGKSTIFHSLDYLLGINTIPATQLQSRFTKSAAYVEGIFRHDSGIITVRRCKKTGLTITTPTEVTSGNVDLAEQELDKLIGVPRKLFKKIIHKPQREFGFFLQMTAKQTYLFLIELLGLKPYQDKIDLISQQITDKTKATESCSISLEGLLSSLDELMVLKNNEVAPVCLVDEGVLSDNRALLEQLNSTLKQNKDLLASKLSELIMPVKSTVEYDNSTTIALESHIKRLKTDKEAVVQSTISKRQEVNSSIYMAKNTISSIQTAKLEAVVIGKTIVDLKEKKAHVETNQCPTCLQSWVTGEAQEYVKTLSEEINNSIKDALAKKVLIEQETDVQNNIVKLEAELTSLQEPDTSSIDTQILGLQEQLSQEKNKIANYTKELESEYLKEHNLFLQKQNEITELYQPEITKIEASISTLTVEINTQDSNLTNYQTNYQSHLKKLADLEVVIKNKKDGIKQHKEGLANLKREIEVASESKRVIKLYTLQIFQDTLDTIGENATEILGNVHNMVDSSIYFEGCKENKNGNIKDEVTAIITKKGEHNIPIKTLSGGERTVVDLAVDLAVIDVIEDKVGKGANFFIIDEPFDGLDSEGKEQYLEILKTLNTNKQIILVDHSPELKEMISDVIKIEI